MDCARLTPSGPGTNTLTLCPHWALYLSFTGDILLTLVSSGCYTVEPVYNSHPWDHA